MTIDFVAYKKFTDAKSAETIMNLLQERDIECLLQDDQHSYVKVVGYNQVDFGITLNIKENNITEADKILEEYYSQHVQEVDKDYYLFEFTDKELKDIIANPFDWGQFDYQLAKQILKEKGIEFSDNHLQEKKDERITELSKIKKVPMYMFIAGYIFAIALPPVGMLLGIMIVYNRNLLPNGTKFYIHSPKDRNQGKMILGISILWAATIILRLMIR
jgi:hypothetical protein